MFSLFLTSLRRLVTFVINLLPNLIPQSSPYVDISGWVLPWRLPLDLKVSPLLCSRVHYHFILKENHIHRQVASRVDYYFEKNLLKITAHIPLCLHLPSLGNLDPGIERRSMTSRYHGSKISGSH